MALKPCRECGNEVSTSASTCPHCGVKNPVKSSDWSGCGGCALALVALVVFGMFASAISSFQDERASRAREEAAAEREAELRQEWEEGRDSLLEVARTALGDGNPERARVTLDRYQSFLGEELRPMWDSISAAAQEARNDRRAEEIIAELLGVPASEALRNAELYEELARLRPENPSYAERAAMYRNRHEAGLRRAFAETYETELLRDGIDARVRVSGPNGTRLEMEYVLAGRVMVQQMNDDPTFLRNIRSLGFDQFRLTDGYDFSWRWTWD